jgi:hypothetical protein
MVRRKDFVTASVLAVGLVATLSAPKTTQTVRAPVPQGPQ